MLKLHIQDDDGQTTIVPVVRDEITIGRKEGNTIRLTERNVSRNHARLVRDNGALILTEVSARFGTRVNGLRVEGPTELLPNDVIQIGDYLVAVHDEQPAAALDPSATATVTDIPTARRVDTVPTMDSADDAMNTAMISTEGLPIAIEDEVREIDLADQARLVAISSNVAPIDVTVTRTPFIIGRTDENDLQLDHRSISRHHISVEFDGGGYCITDMGSANGVKINGDLYKRADLHPGDVIELGHVRLRYVAPGEVYEPGVHEDFDDLLVAELAPSRFNRFLMVSVIIAALSSVGLWVFHFSKAPPKRQPTAITEIEEPSDGSSEKIAGATPQKPEMDGDEEPGTLNEKAGQEKAVDPVNRNSNIAAAAAKPEADEPGAGKEANGIAAPTTDESANAPTKVETTPEVVEAKPPAPKKPAAKKPADKESARRAAEARAAKREQAREAARAEKESKKRQAAQLVQRGNALMGQKKYKAASDAYRRALRLDRKNRNAKKGLKSARSAAKKEAAAKERERREAARTARAEAKKEKLALAKQYAAEAKAAKRASNLTKAKALYKKCIATHPGLASCRADLAIILMAQGSHCAAIRQMRRYVRARPGSGKAVQFRRLIEQFEPQCN